MPDYNLTVNFPVSNPSRLEVADVRERAAVENDPNSSDELHVRIELRTNQATDRQYGSYLVVCRNGRSGQLRPRSPAAPAGGTATPYPAGMVLQDMLYVSDPNLNPEGNPATAGVNTPTGFTQALAAWRSGSASGGGAGNRRKALMQVLKDLDVIMQGLTPTAPTPAGPLAGVVP